MLTRCLLGLWVAVVVAMARELPANAVEVGLLSTSGVESLTVTVALSLSDLAGAEELLDKINTVGDDHFGKFLTPNQFYQLFGPKKADVKKVKKFFGSHGLTVSETTPTTLQVTGPVGSIESAFRVELTQYHVPATETKGEYTFHAPSFPPVLPEDVTALISTVAGLDTRPHFRHHVTSRADKYHGLKMHPANFSHRSSRGEEGEGEEPYLYNPFGEWTVTDFAHYYNVEPLYRQGIKGDGQTIGIVSFASIVDSDVYAYWNAIGLNVDKNRLKTVLIDGGAPYNDDSVETTLDIEQSGGVAPHAKIIFYSAPNTDQGYIDAFARAVSDNDCQTLSISWGGWEFFSNDFSFQGYSSYVAALHSLFVQAALQGQSVFAASGDQGAYTVNGQIGCFGPFLGAGTCSNVLSVSYPASDSAITAVGGTTLAFGANIEGVIVSVPHERVWGEDYMTSYCSIVNGQDPVACEIFPYGGGGGVSVVFGRPSYQQHIYNVQQSEANQAFEFGASPAILDLPANFSGRNLPDVSFNSDGLTGYIIYFTDPGSGTLQVLTFQGGTSFAAPQLNGVAALFGQYTKRKRIGLLNYPIYHLIRSGYAYDGDNAPLNRINYGNNWFYHGSPGYNLGSGAGTINVARFAAFLKAYFEK